MTYNNLIVKFGGTKMNWYESHPRKVHLDMHSPKRIKDIGKGLDIDAYADAIAASGADAAVCFTKCAYGYTYAKNDFLPTHPGMIREDLFGDLRKALLKRGVEMVAYVSACGLSIDIQEIHPEWVGIDKNGDKLFNVEDKEMGLTCPNSDYWKEGFIPFVAQVVKDNQLKAIWMDGYYQLLNRTCYCDKCREDFGKPIPVDKEDKNWRPYYAYVHQKIRDILADITRTLKAIDPECCIGGDWIGSTVWGDQVPEAVDYFSCDVHPNIGSFETAYVSSAWSWRDKPVDLYTQRMYWWQDFNTKPVTAIIQDQAFNIASGGIWMIGDVVTPYAMKVESEKSRLYKEVFEALNPLYEATREGSHKAEIAMLLSVEDTRNNGDRWSVNNDKHKGVYSALSEAGYPAHILYESDLKAHLFKYKYLVVTEAEFLSSQTCKVIKDFVELGGKLLVTGYLPIELDSDKYIDETTVYDRSVFEALTGNKWLEDVHNTMRFFNVDQTPMAKLWGDAYRLPERVDGTFTKASDNGSEILSTIIEPGNSFQIGAKVPGEQTDYVAFSKNQYGKGQVYYSSLPLGSNAWGQGHFSSYHAIQCITDELLQDYEYRLDGPSDVQLFPVIGEKEVYSLVAHQQPAQINRHRQKMKLTSISNCTIVVKGEIKKACDLITGKTLSFTLIDGRTHIQVLPFTIYASVGVER